MVLFLSPSHLEFFEGGEEKRIRAARYSAIEMFMKEQGRGSCW